MRGHYTSMESSIKNLDVVKDTCIISSTQPILDYMDLIHKELLEILDYWIVNQYSINCLLYENGITVGKKIKTNISDITLKDEAIFRHLNADNLESMLLVLGAIQPV